MLERVIENWLDKATELSYQIPYCYMLSAEGHTIIHLTRHGAMEMGKDIITIGPDGSTEGDPPPDEVLEQINETLRKVTDQLKFD